MYPFYLGIDLHLKRTYVVLMNAEGEVIDKRRLLNTEMAIYICREVPKKTYAVMEAVPAWVESHAQVLAAVLHLWYQPAIHPRHLAPAG